MILNLIRFSNSKAWMTWTAEHFVIKLFSFNNISKNKQTKYKSIWKARPIRRLENSHIIKISWMKKKIYPSLINSLFLLYWGSWVSAGASPSCHRVKVTLWTSARFIVSIHTHTSTDNLKFPIYLTYCIGSLQVSSRRTVTIHMKNMQIQHKKVPEDTGNWTQYLFAGRQQS